MRQIVVISLVGLIGSLGCGGVRETPAGTEVLRVALADLTSPAADVRTRLTAGTPPTETASVTCREAAIEVAFERRRDPVTSAQYFDALIVRVQDPAGARVTARRLNPENRGTTEAIEMALPIVVRVERGRSFGDCSYLVRASGSPAVEPI